jgi:putative copper resistance protein D
MLLALMRGLFVAGALSSFGTLLFGLAVWTPAARALDAAANARIARRLRTILAASLGLALIAGLDWLVLQAHAMAEAQTLGETLAAVPSVLFGTRFGQLLVAQAGALIGAAVCAALRRNLPATLLAGLAVLLEAGHSHAFAMAHGLSPLLLSQVLHLLAAGGWLGGLLPLRAVVTYAPLDLAWRALHRFSTLAATAVCVLAATALLQGVELSGGLKGLFGTDYGTVLLVKAALFLVLIAIGANNRLRLTPALAGARGEDSRRALALSIFVETAIGLLVVFAAAALSGLEPGIHITSD